MGYIAGLDIKLRRLNQLDVIALNDVEKLIQDQKDLIDNLKKELASSNSGFVTHEQRSVIRKELQRAIMEFRRALRMQGILVQRLRMRKRHIKGRSQADSLKVGKK